MRKSGILLHIASLPNKYGIGTMGREAYKFVDWLRSAGQSLWQILPLSQTSFGDSPYQSFSIYAGNPYFISLETLEEEGLLKHKEYADINWCKDPRYIDYATMYENFYKVMRLAFGRFSKDRNGNVSEEYKAFVAENPWLENYTLFMALKDAHGGKSWCEWETPLRLRDVTAVYSAKKKYAKDMEFYAFLQFEFFRQWYKLKKYANDNGIQIIGDIPIYCALDSADVWCEPQLFQLDRDRVPTVVAGFPPDAFSEDGQLWGNPIYDWDRMKQENYRWWVGRMSFAKKLYDIVRIDHFIGFNSYYAIPFGSKTAHGGEWHDGPKYDLFNVIKRETGKGGIIAEDLGDIFDSVKKLLGKTDIVLLDIKFSRDDLYKKYIGVSLSAPLAFLAECEKAKKRVIIRQVITPGINDTEDDVLKLREILKPFNCVEKTELLPFRKLCKEKYESLNIFFPFGDREEMPQEKLNELQKLL